MPPRMPATGTKNVISLYACAPRLASFECALAAEVNAQRRNAPSGATVMSGAAHENRVAIS